MRKTQEITIGPDGGRDAGKVYVITEMPAEQAEKFAARSLLAAAQSGADISDVRGGLAGFARMGVTTAFGIKWPEFEPILDEMFECVAFRPNPTQSAIFRGGKYCPGAIGRLMPDDIEEVATRYHLRGEALTLHLGFSLADSLSKLGMEESARTASQTTPTSPASSVP